MGWKQIYLSNPFRWSALICLLSLDTRLKLEKNKIKITISRGPVHISPHFRVIAEIDEPSDPCNRVKSCFEMDHIRILIWSKTLEDDTWDVYSLLHYSYEVIVSIFFFSFNECICWLFASSQFLWKHKHCLCAFAAVVALPVFIYQLLGGWAQLSRSAATNTDVMTVFAATLPPPHRVPGEPRWAFTQWRVDLSCQRDLFQRHVFHRRLTSGMSCK